jgi:hypothetical protein
MAIFDLFSKRQRRQRGELPDVYQYDAIPKPLRAQLVHIIRDALGEFDRFDRGGPLKVLTFIHETLCREYGVFALAHDAQFRGPKPQEDVYRFILDEPDAEKVIDAVELTLRAIDCWCRDSEYRYLASPTMTADEAIDEANERFREHGVGFQFESGKIIRVDSQLIHQETVRPALQLLSAKRYNGANEEFLRAHEHFRNGRLPESLNDALKALESVLKAICDERKWNYSPGDTAKPLLNIVFLNGLVPPFLQSQFASIRATLETGVPTIRNKLGGHGQGTTPISVPPHFAAYQLHMTASAIVFLVECEKALP